MRVEIELPDDIAEVLPKVIEDGLTPCRRPDHVLVEIIREWMETTGYLEVPPPREGAN